MLFLCWWICSLFGCLCILENRTISFKVRAGATRQARRDGRDEQLKARMLKLVDLILGKLNKRDRTKIITLITADVHNYDVVGHLVEKKASSEADFAWQSQSAFFF